MAWRNNVLERPAVVRSRFRESRSGGSRLKRKKKKKEGEVFSRYLDAIRYNGRKKCYTLQFPPDQLVGFGGWLTWLMQTKHSTTAAW